MRQKHKWYAAHILMAVKRVDGRQRAFPVYENIVLLRARDGQEALREAEALAHREYEGDDSVTLGGQRARVVFLSVRRVVECQDSTERSIRYPHRDLAPGHGTEVTYSLYRVSGRQNLSKLARGEAVDIIYEK
jgi:hypothetical protein